MENLIKLIICLIPLQILTTVPVGNTKVDLTIFLSYFLILRFKKLLNYLIIVLIFIVLHLVISRIFHGNFDFNSFLSSIFTIPIAIAFCFFDIGKKTRDNFLYFATKGLTISTYILLASFPLYLLLNQNFRRLKLFFVEPSYCALFVGGLIVFWLNKLIFTNKRNFLPICSLIIILLGILVLTKSSSSFITLFIGISISALIYFLPSLKENKLIINKIPKNIFFYIIIPSFIGILLFQSFLTQSMWKINFQDIDNLSSLSSYMGFIQMIEGLKQTFLIGTGLGQTGTWLGETSSILDYLDYSIISYTTSFWYSNVYDCYSLFFRLGVELGIFGLLYCIYLIISSINLHKQLSSKIDPKVKVNYIPSLMFFLTLFIGALLKLPVYTFNIVMFPLLILSIINKPPKLNNFLRIINSQK